jgi:hypothetical protein
VAGQKKEEARGGGRRSCGRILHSHVSQSFKHSVDCKPLLLVAFFSHVTCSIGYYIMV